MKLPLLLVGLLSFCVSSVLAETAFLAQKGHSDYRIILPTKAAAAEQHAAEELAHFLREITGMALPISNEEGQGTFGPRIYVGWSDAAGKLVSPEEVKNLDDEEFIVETHGSDLLLAGGSPRGTLYAVYSFLEDDLGCRWFSPKVSYIPKKADLPLPTLKRKVSQVFENREPFAYSGYDGDWAARNRCNGHSSHLDEAHGGKIEYIGFVHTFFPLLPPEKYFQEHPEYYAMLKGKRTVERSQLCLTNPDVLRLVTEKVIDLAKKASPRAIISVSQNDWHGWCECEACRAVEEEEGGVVSGPLLRFVNAVAEKVEAVRPDVAIDTLAYQKSRKAPKLVKPRKNVIIRLCSIECSFSHPLEGDGPNKTFADDIRDWSKISSRLYIWDYVTNFRHYLLPHPNFRVLQPNLAFFAAHGVKGIFEQGSYQSPGGEFQELRNWVLAKLMANPNADMNALVDEFLAGYYGPAAPEIRRYFDLMHDAVEKSDVLLTCNVNVSATLFTADLMLEANRLWEAAEAKATASGDQDLLLRVQVGRLPVDYTLMLREPMWRHFHKNWDVKRQGSELRDHFFAIAKAAKITHIAESKTLEVFRDEMLMPARHEPSLPEEIKKRDRKDWYDVQDDGFRLAKAGYWVTTTPDPQASDGVAAKFATDHYEWAVSIPFDAPELATDADGGADTAWRVQLAIRVEPTDGAAPDTAAFTCGIYDGLAKKSIANKQVQVSQLKDTAYQLYDLGVHKVGEQRYVWVAPAKNPDQIKAVWVDRLLLTRETPPPSTEPAKGK